MKWTTEPLVLAFHVQTVILCTLAKPEKLSSSDGLRSINYQRTTCSNPSLQGSMQ